MTMTNKVCAWTILADRYLDFHSLCALLTVDKRRSALVDLRQHRWHEDPKLNNNVVGRLERAFTASMVHLRKFGMEHRTLTKRELWPYYGVELEQQRRWTIVAPSVALCESTNHWELRESESFGESVDGYERWPDDDESAKCSRAFARVKTSHWRTKTPFLRMLYMQKLRHSACRHTARLAEFSARFSRGQKEKAAPEAAAAANGERQFKARVLRRSAEPMRNKGANKKRKRKPTEQSDADVETGKQRKTNRASFAPRLVNFEPKRDCERLLATKH